MKKTTITLFSISTIFVVLVIAVIALLIGNYTKNFNSGINLEPQVINIYTHIDNNSITKDKVWVITSTKEYNEIIYQNISKSPFNDYIILGILGMNQSNPGYCYKLELDSVRLRSSQININYQTRYNKTNCEALLQESAPYGPQTFFKISRDKLPVGIPLEFIFYNRTEKTEQIINQTLTL